MEGSEGLKSGSTVDLNDGYGFYMYYLNETTHDAHKERPHQAVAHTSEVSKP